MSWQTKAIELHTQGKAYAEIGRMLDKSRQSVRYAIMKNAKQTEDQQELALSESDTSAQELKALKHTIYEVLKQQLKRQRTMNELLRKLPTEATEELVKEVMEQLLVEDHFIDVVDGRYFFRSTISPLEEVRNVLRDWNGDTIIKFGLCSDTHINSKYQQLTHLNSFYDLCVAEGISDVYHVGDISEGAYTKRDGHLYEIFNQSVDEQVDYIIKNYPRRPGIHTSFITGNHDHTFLKQAGYDIGRPIARERDDMTYLGINYASIQLTPNCRMDLAHPLDGSSYALSYALQKSIEAMPVDNLPDIYIVGHHHKAIYLHTRGIHALEAGTFQAQTGWMRGKRLAAHVGGWIITIHVDKEGYITRFLPEWVPFDKMIKNDY